MITGNVSIVGTQNNPVFVVQAGPNYPAASAAGAISWTPASQLESSGTSMGQVDLEGIANQTTYLANVLDLNITLQHAVAGTLYLNFTGTFPSGAMVWINETMVNIHHMNSSAFLASGQSINSASFEFTSFAAFSTYYISFYLPPGSYGSATGTLTGTFIAS